VGPVPPAPPVPVPAARPAAASAGRPPGVRRLALARSAWALVLLTAPDRVARVLGVTPSWRSRAVLRVLGCRHLAQAALSELSPSTGSQIGVAVDVAHALSAVAYGASAPDRRRTGALMAGGATTFATAGVQNLRAEHSS
jgi:hypothetical protein